jgi:tape measure domain-containing protein
MAVIGNLRVNLGLNSAEFDTGLDKAKGKADNFASGITKSLAGVAAAFAAAFSVRAMGQMADAWSDMNSRLKNATGSMEAGAAAMDRLQVIARRSYSSINQTTEAFLRQSTTLTALGVSTDRQLDLTETLNNALVISATRGDKAASVMDAWGKAMATGSLRGQNLNSVISGSDRLAQALADSMGINVTELRKYGEQGKITREVMLGVTSQMEKLRDEAAEMPATIADGFTILGDSVLQLVGRVDQAVGASGGFAEILIGVGDTITAITPAVIALAGAVGGALSSAFETFGPLLAIAGAGLSGFAVAATISGVMALASAVAGPLVAAFAAFNAILMANPIIGWIGVFASVVTAAFFFRDKLAKIIGFDLFEVVKGIGNRIIGIFQGAYNAVVEAWSNLPTFFTALGKEAWNSFIEAFEKPALTFTGWDGIERTIIPGLDLSGMKASLSGDEQTALGKAGATMGAALDRDYFAEWGDALGSLGDASEETAEAVAALNGALDTTGTSAGGAGAAINDKMNTALEAMRTALMTEEQTELASYEKRLAQIQEFYDRGLIQKAEYDSMMEAAHEQHSERMLAITQKQVQEEARIRGQLVGHTSSILGSLSTIMENFGDDNLAASKAFAIAAAIINTAEGITKALAQGGLLGFAGAAAVAAAGVAQISTIMSAKKGGSSRPTVGASAPSVAQGAAAKPSQAVSISLQGDYHPTQQVEELIGKLLDMQSDGYQIVLERP